MRHLKTNEFMCKTRCLKLSDDCAVDVGEDILLHVVFVHDGNDRAVGDADNESHIIHQHERILAALGSSATYCGLQSVQMARLKLYVTRLQSCLRMC